MEQVRTTAEITAALQEGIRSLCTSDRYQAYLRAMSYFHGYSFNNTVLIFQQKPDATLVAGYRVWQTRFCRQVRRGEKAIRIFAPMRISVQRRDSDDSEQILRYRAASVFDISQTAGKELPSSLVSMLSKDVPDYSILLRALIHSSPVPVFFSSSHSDTNGFFDPTAQRISIKNGLPQAQTIKTLIHEIAHAIMHGGEEKMDPRVREIEAESVAYTVCQRFGIDASDYSFGYIAGWSASHDTRELQASMERICRASDQLISALSASFCPAAPLLLRSEETAGSLELSHGAE